MEPTPLSPSAYPVEDPNIDHLSTMFFQDLGMPLGGGSGANFWQTGSAVDPDMNGPTPPDTYAFLGTQVDWANIGLNQREKLYLACYEDLGLTW